MSAPQWVVEGQLARSSRPGYPSVHVGSQVVDAWIAVVSQMGVRSLICLLADEELRYFYRQIEGGLLARYARAGFEVVHVPIPDPAYDPRGYDVLAKNRDGIIAAFAPLPRPVLIHCSAGICRTGEAVEAIQRRFALAAGPA